MDHEALLRRISQTLKKEIGPNVDGEYPKTQAYMASVVLEKLAGEIGAASNNADCDQAERNELVAELAAIDTSNVSLPALRQFAKQVDEQSLCDLIAEIYQQKSALGNEVVESILAPIRKHLRASVNRRLEYSR